jgi:hypothetical protein
MPSRAFIRRCVTPPLVILAVLVVLFEATFWHWMIELGAWLARRVPLFAALERLVERWSPQRVCLLFVVPLAMLVPVSLFADWLILRGRVLDGVALLIGAKIVGTAFSARLFAVAKPKLMLVPAFACAYGVVTRLIARARAYLDALPAWQIAQRSVASAHRWIAAGRHGLLGCRFAAARRRAARRGFVA